MKATIILTVIVGIIFILKRYFTKRLDSSTPGDFGGDGWPWFFGQIGCWIVITVLGIIIIVRLIKHF